MTSNILVLDLIRALVLGEILVVIIFSVAAVYYYIKRLKVNTDARGGLSWHVVLVASVFIALLIDRFTWVWTRFGHEDFSPERTGVYAVMFGVAVVAQGLLYVRQVAKLREGK